MSMRLGGRLLLLGLSAGRGASAAAAAVGAAAGDGSALVQESLRVRRHAEEAEQGLPLDLDGCPADDAQIEALRSSLQGACGSSRRTGLANRVNCALSVRRREDEGDAKMKEIYFMRHAQPRCCTDCGLDRTGREQCEGLKANNTLLNEGPLSNDTSKQAQIIYVSPTTRTLETAVRVFGHLNVPMVIDYRLVETFGFDSTYPCKHCVERALQELNRGDLLWQYQTLQQDPAESFRISDQHSNIRIAKFIHHLQHSPEERIVVVAHHVLLDNFRLGMSCMQMGETIVKMGLTVENWYSMSPGSCTDRRRRWPYGNFQRRVERGVDSEDGEALELAEGEEDESA